jgi:hypothetical protein
MCAHVQQAGNRFVNPRLADRPGEICIEGCVGLGSLEVHQAFDVL